MISPLEECKDHRHSGGKALKKQRNKSIKCTTTIKEFPFFALTGIYYEEGCAHKFLVWLKAWAGAVFVVTIIIVSLEVSGLQIGQKMLTKLQLMISFS